MKEERSVSNFSHSDYLLVSQRAEKMHRDAVRDWLAKISKELGFKLHPHLFRHTFLHKASEKRCRPNNRKQTAGHSTVNMTARFYIQTTKQEKMDAVNLL